MLAACVSPEERRAMHFVVCGRVATPLARFWLFYTRKLISYQRRCYAVRRYSGKIQRHSGAVDQGRQGLDQMDPAVLPFLCGQRRPPPAPCPGLHLGNFSDLRADLDELLAQAGQRPWLRRLGYCKGARQPRYVTFQMAEVAVSRQMFADICRLLSGSGHHPRPHERSVVRRADRRRR
jgi:hypothetical protein